MTKNNKEWVKQYRIKNHEKIRGYEKKYYYSHQDQINKKARERRSKNREFYNTYAKEYYKRNKLVINARNRQRDRDLRLKVIGYYSNGLMCCGCCGEKMLEFLTIDHINGQGHQHRKNINNKLYNWLKAENFPTGYQVLCMNCNLAKGIYGECPHQKEKIQIVR